MSSALPVLTKYSVHFPQALSPCTAVFVPAIYMGLQILTLEPLFATESQRHKYQVCTVCRLYYTSHLSRAWRKHGYFLRISSEKLHLRFGIFFTFLQLPPGRQSVRACGRGVRFGEALKWAAALSLCLPACQPVRVELSAASPLVCCFVNQGIHIPGFRLELRLSECVSKGTIQREW